ncbi:MAG: type I restriction enzyme HsdR N-terminal domain-containing protein [Planctomycetes bacterium]|nr:type I restriction enzyme HsdR N-terminal domain-containing protein [Planctomycetota bacterium]MBL7146495.1 type I restriction enzyme HsdR N-terminal domain-containing protein [Phycisphaerae bacterium]
MKDTISDICQKIANSAYKNEEHVRLSLVARVLQKLGWNIWDPCEVNSEYNATPHEDSTRVDIALFLTPRRPDVFIEVKAIGKITSDSLQRAELQLRDYNRDNTASFSIITDGRIWRFYLSQSGGKFKEKCFKVVDLLTDDLDGIEVSLCTFLKKSEIENGNAFREAQKYRKLNDKQRAMEDSLPQARRVILEPPYPSLPDALIELVAEEGFTINVEEAQEFIKVTANRALPPLQTPLDLPKNVPDNKPQPVFGPKSEILSFRPDEPPNLSFTKIINATFGTQSTNKWNALVRCAVKEALQKNMSLSRLKSLLSNVQEGQINDNGYRPLPGMNVSVQGVAAGNAWSLALLLAKELNVEITVRFRWREKDGAAYPGQEGLLQWKP